MDNATRLAQIRAARIHLLYCHGPSGYVIPAVVTVVVLTFSAALWSMKVTGQELILRWAFLSLTVQALHVAMVWAYNRGAGAQATPEATSFWGHLKTLQAVLHGVCWSLLMIEVYTPGEAPTLIYPALGIIGLSACTAVFNAAHMPSLVSFLSCALLPAAGYLGWQGGQIELFMAIALVMLWLFLIGGGIVGSHVVQGSIVLQLDLAERMRQERVLMGQLQASSTEKARFFGAASHDLRQPVHALGLYASLLRRDPPITERLELIDRVATCVDNLDRLFGAILGVAQAGIANVDADIQPLALQPLIDRVLVQFWPEAMRRGLRLRNCRTRLWVNGDAATLERILGNLVSNALNYTETGKVLVGVRRRGTAVELVVADTGVGIRQQDQERIFDDFFQANNERRDRQRSFGLGLATVRRLCEAFQYPIRLRSEAGRGSIFTVALPLTMPVTAGLTASTPAALPEQELNVLFVEDDALVRDAMRRMLANWGVRTHLYATGDEALAALEGAGGRWHVLLDYRLDGAESGLDIADRIRAQHDPAPVISLLTGEADEALIDAARDRGILVLSKPLKPIRLRALLFNPHA